MTNAVTHFEIYSANPAALADFYRKVFGWEVDPMPGVDYWRISTGAAESSTLAGGLTYRAIPGLNGWMLYVNVASLDDTVALVQSLGGSIVRPKTAVPKTAWVTIIADPAENIFGVWQADSTAFPPPEPD
jgi:predicted enzyme related to lactoylglutathione lyase